MGRKRRVAHAGRCAVDRIGQPVQPEKLIQAVRRSEGIDSHLHLVRVSPAHREFQGYKDPSIPGLLDEEEAPRRSYVKVSGIQISIPIEGPLSLFQRSGFDEDSEGLQVLAIEVRNMFSNVAETNDAETLRLGISDEPDVDLRALGCEGPDQQNPWVLEDHGITPPTQWGCCGVQRRMDAVPTF